MPLRPTAIAAIALGSLTGAEAKQLPPDPAGLAHVIDGDTLEVGGTRVRLRFLWFTSVWVPFAAFASRNLRIEPGEGLT